MTNTALRIVLPTLLALLLPAMGVAAQEIDAAADNSAASIDARRQASLSEYEQVTREMTLSGEKLAKLAADIATVKKDSVSITAALIQTAKTDKKLSGDIEEIEQRIGTLKDQERAAHGSLIARRDVLANVLGALQRMGLNPPPALLVKPEDALSSVRSAILLGAVVPELRQETEILLADLDKISRLSASIEAERDGLRNAVESQLAKKRRLEILLDEKKKLRAQSELAIGEERKRSIELASKAGSMKELLAALDQETRKAAKAAEALKSEPEAENVALLLPDANLLLGPQPFESLKRQLETPASGRFSKRFGSSDGNGGLMLGDTVATQSDSIVTSPADGNVLYAGPFRSYGQLLILDVGNGYHVLLAGMSRINVAPGQPVLSGEPVGSMGGAKVASAAGNAIGTAGSELYVEFRKDGKPVDPAPWWARRLSGRTGNDT